MTTLTAAGPGAAPGSPAAAATCPPSQGAGRRRAWAPERPAPTAAGTRRRLRALAVLGWPPAALAARLRLSPAAVRQMRDTPITRPRAPAPRAPPARARWAA